MMGSLKANVRCHCWYPGAFFIPVGPATHQRQPTSCNMGDLKDEWVAWGSQVTLELRLEHTLVPFGPQGIFMCVYMADTRLKSGEGTYIKHTRTHSRITL